MVLLTGFAWREEGLLFSAGLEKSQFAFMLAGCGPFATPGVHDDEEGSNCRVGRRLEEMSADSVCNIASHRSDPIGSSENDPRYRTKLAPGTAREKFTSRRRPDKGLKPIYYFQRLMTCVTRAEYQTP